MNAQTRDLAGVLKECTLEFFGKSRHKVEPQDLAGLPDVLLLDVRSKEEFASLSAPLGFFSNIRFMHIPVHELPGRIDEIPFGKNVVIFCPSNFRSTLAYVYLKIQGHESARILGGGYQGLTDAVMPGKIYKLVSGIRPREA